MHDPITLSITVIEQAAAVQRAFMDEDFEAAKTAADALKVAADTLAADMAEYSPPSGGEYPPSGS